MDDMSMMKRMRSYGIERGLVGGLEGGGEGRGRKVAPKE